MNRTVLILALVCSLGLGSPIDGAKLLSTNPEDRQQLISEFKKDLQKAPEKEKELWKKMISAYEAFDGSKQKLKTFLTTMADCLERFLLLYPNSSEIQTDYLGYLSHIALTMKHSGLSLEKRGSELLKKSLDQIKKYVEDHPADAKGYEMLALLLVRSEAEGAAIANAYAKCFELDANNAYCKAGLDSAKKAAKIPRCTGKNINPEIEFHIVSEKQDEEHGKNLVFGSEDIKEVILDSDVTANFVLNPKGAEKLADATRKNVGKYAVLTAEKEVLSNAKIMMGIKGGRFQVNPEKGLLKKLCRKLD